MWNGKFNDNECLKNEVILLEAIQKQYGKDAVKILALFNSLNKNGKQKAVENLEDFTAIEKYIETEGE